MSPFIFCAGLVENLARQHLSRQLPVRESGEGTTNRHQNSLDNKTMAANIAPAPPIGILLLSHHPRKSISMPRTHAGRSRASALTIATLAPRSLSRYCAISTSRSASPTPTTRSINCYCTPSPRRPVPTQRHGQCRRMNKNEALCAALLSARYLRYSARQRLLLRPSTIDNRHRSTVIGMPRSLVDLQ